MPEQPPPLLKSIWQLKCPQCRKGELFVHKGWLNFGTLHEMPHACKLCGQVYELEIGFWWGSMYVGYGLCLALMFAILAADLLLTGYIERTTIFLAIGVVFLLWAQIFRLSRAIWLYTFVPYRGNADADET